MGKLMKRVSAPGLVTSTTTAALILAVSFFWPGNAAFADEGGVSFWLPGLFGSLAAAPQQPGWSLMTTYYNTTVSAGGNVGFAREAEIGKVPVNFSGTLGGTLNSNANLALVNPTYVFATPLFGGQAAVGLMGIYGGMDTTLNATLNGTITPPGLPITRSDSFNSGLMGFGDLYPQFTLRWNAGVNNFMTYVTGDLPLGAYDSARLSNIGIGHGAVDAGGGYTYFNPATGHEFSVVTGFTYNLENPATNYQNGVDWHTDWGLSQFMSKQFSFGAVGYFYKEVGCDSGSGDRVGCFQSQVIGVGPQMTFLFPVGTMQGYLNFKAYGEFDNVNRPDGWNAWVTFMVSPAAPRS